ncbi:Crp/Fnr family transcriptional regulator [Roseomonas arctica]|uniref:Crp/Fnr family transcriptional regulator n=2 Tax=Plastoroseomonas arctica TaxID=1509237 RepID=A0AAF1K1F7_9PROT|nr:Crp/Fnr family transcriptional regulator [Plastoroseomonas arctica]
MKVGQAMVSAGASILHEGGRAAHLFTVLRGWAFRYKTLPDGRRQILNILLPGDLVGLQAEIATPVPHSVEALTEVELCAFGEDALWTLYRDHPELALDVTWLSANEERIVDEALVSTGRRTALERVAALLVYLYKRASVAGLVQSGTAPLPLTQSHLADTLGLSLVHTNRTLQRLRKGGFIRLEEGRLAIGDLTTLSRVAAYWEAVPSNRPLL